MDREEALKLASGEKQKEFINWLYDRGLVIDKEISSLEKMMGKKLTKIEFSPPLEIEKGETIIVNTNPPIKIIGGSSQLDRIERMLKWIVITTQMERRSTLAGLGCNPEAIGKELDGLCGKAPDVSDIIREKK